MILPIIHPTVELQRLATFDYLDRCGDSVDDYHFKIGPNGYLRKQMIRCLRRLYGYTVQGAEMVIEDYRFSRFKKTGSMRPGYSAEEG